MSEHGKATDEALVRSFFRHFGPSTPVEMCSHVGRTPSRLLREAMWRLIDRGELRLTVDRKVAYRGDQ